MRAVLALALVACQRTEPTPPVVGSGSSLNVVLVGCAPAGERPRVAKPHVRKDGDLGDVPMIPGGWFPYAPLGTGDDDRAEPVAVRAKAALAAQLGDLDLCLTGKTGSVSIMIDVAKNGAITPRVGGVGHRPTEQCVANVVKTLKISPAEIPVDIECGLSAGAAGPFRVTVDGGYRVAEITREQITIDGKPQDLKGVAPNLLDTYLVVADPDVDAADLARLLRWVGEAPAVLVAVRADGGPPVFVGMAPDRRRGTVKEPRLGVYVADQQLQACAGSQRGMASLLEPKRVDAMLGTALAACSDCDDVVEVGVGGNHTAKQLVGATSGVRRAGRDPVLSIGSRCAL
ncbi:MAG: hypothetical protein H0V17_03950 [Deltaproteobacteria bacterium]|nr:hypothetical protein [Deltaproteobacteria bacterium]